MKKLIMLLFIFIVSCSHKDEKPDTPPYVPPVVEPSPVPSAEPTPEPTPTPSATPTPDPTPTQPPVVVIPAPPHVPELPLIQHPSSCPSPGNYSMQTQEGGMPNILKMPTGHIATFQINQGERASQQMTLGQMPISPGSGSVVEMSVSKCPGVILNIEDCYVRTGFLNFISITFFSRTSAQYPNKESMRGRYCAALDSPSYVNIRYNYTVCPIGTCGFSAQWGTGPY